MSLDFDGFDPETGEVFDFNITHNLIPMAEAAGVFQVLWRPEKGKLAGEVAPVLRKGIERMEADPDKFTAFNVGNGWGTYPQFLGFLREVAEACEAFPGAIVRADV